MSNLKADKQLGYLHPQRETEMCQVVLKAAV